MGTRRNVHQLPFVVAMITAAAASIATPAASRAQSSCDAVLKFDGATETFAQSASSNLQRTFYQNMCTQHDWTIARASRAWSDIAAGAKATVPIETVLVGGAAHYESGNSHDERQFQEDLQRTCNQIVTTGSQVATFYQAIKRANEKAIEAWEACMGSEGIHVGIAETPPNFILYVDNKVSGHPDTRIDNFSAPLSWSPPESKPPGAPATASCLYNGQTVLFPKTFENDRKVALVCEKPLDAQATVIVSAQAMIDGSSCRDCPRDTIRMSVPEHDSAIDRLKVEVSQLRTDLLAVIERQPVMQAESSCVGLGRTGGAWDKPEPVYHTSSPDHRRTAELPPVQFKKKFLTAPTIFAGITDITQALEPVSSPGRSGYGPVAPLGLSVNVKKADTAGLQLEVVTDADWAFNTVRICWIAIGPTSKDK